MDKHSIARILIISHGIMLSVLAVLITLDTPFWLMFPVMTVLTGLIIWQISNRLAKQSEMISVVVNKVTEGDHSQRVPEMELDEFDHMGQDLNRMLGKLDNTIHHLAIHREELRLVLDSIDDVLWSQNMEGKLEWVNRAFKDLFGGYDAEKEQYYWDVIREPELIGTLKGALEKGERLLKEVQMNEAAYLLSGNRNVAAGRWVFIMQDISGIRQAEQMKKDFVVNLAHELRTPLTAIKGFSDAMQEHSLPENKRFITIIQNHTNRLIHLIRDLEQLIRLEQNPMLEKRDINLKTFFDNLQLILSPSVDERGLNLKIELDPKVPRLNCDPFKLEQVFINLVENSLRYTEKGMIAICSTALDNELQIEVADTGRGIAANHLPRIFERFYVADPARNRSRSGTGLGLAIVKHILQLHSGRIEVESELGKGTRFRMYLPTNQLSNSW